MFLSDCWKDQQQLGASEIQTTGERFTRVRNPRDVSVTSSGKQEPHGALRGGCGLVLPHTWIKDFVTSHTDFYSL